jgi:alcohol dehydrogenase
MTVPARLLFGGTGLSLDQLVLVETLGIGWHAVARGNPQPEDTVLVLGAGPIGLAVAQAAAPRVKRLLVADRSADRAGFAARTGLDTLVVDQDFDGALAEAFGGEPPTLVVDASGSKESMQAAFERVGAGGTLVLVGHTTGELAFHNPGFHSRELDLRGSRNATPADWYQVLQAVADGMLDAVGWVNHRSSLDRVVLDLPRLAADPGQVVKAVVDLDPDPAVRSLR